MYPVIIIGSGPAGYSAAIYAARASLRPLVMAGSAEPGGDLMTTTRVDNFPGFPEGIQGPDLMENMQLQARRFGAEILFDDVESVELQGEVKRVHVRSESGHSTYESRAIIVASGSEYRRLGVPGEDRLTGRGISWCASCDGFFFTGKEIAVIGGGDSAMEEATFLTRFAKLVTVIHRGGALRASKAMLERARADSKIQFISHSTVEEFTGTEELDGLVMMSPGGERQLDVEGAFIAIGSDPRTQLVKRQLEITDRGTIAVHGRTSRTTISGVFAAGDVVDPIYRQAITSAASGAVAAMDAERFLAAS